MLNLSHLSNLWDNKRDMLKRKDNRQHVTHLCDIQLQNDTQMEMDYDEALQHQLDVDLQEQIHQEDQAEHIQQVMNINQTLKNLPKGCHPYQEPPEKHSLGLMNVECPDCHALPFALEKFTQYLKRYLQFGICCLQGQIQLSPLSEPPSLLLKLFTSSTPCT